MLIQLTKEDESSISINVNHIISISPISEDKTKIVLVNGDEIICVELFQNVHLNIKAIYSKFYKS